MTWEEEMPMATSCMIAPKVVVSLSWRGGGAAAVSMGIVNEGQQERHHW